MKGKCKFEFSKKELKLGQLLGRFAKTQRGMATDVEALTRSDLTSKHGVNLINACSEIAPCLQQMKLLHTIAIIKRVSALDIPGRCALS